MICSPAINTLPDVHVTVLAPSTSSIPHHSLRLLTAGATGIHTASSSSQAPIMLVATLIAADLHSHRRRSSPKKSPRKSEILGNVNADGGFWIRDDPRSNFNAHPDSVMFWRRSFWTEVKVAIDASVITWEEIKLLLPVRLWMNMLRLINLLLLKWLWMNNIVDLEVLVRREMAIERVREDKDDIAKTKREFSLFVTPRGVKLFTQSWTPISDKIKGLVVLLHGLNEHSSRYDKFAKELNAKAFKVYGVDWIGHGGSDGLHGYVCSLDDVVCDTKAFIDEVLARNPGIPCFCFGHSTGGAILLKAALDPKFEAKINGLILTSPAIGVQASLPIYTILAPIVSVLLPRYQCGAVNKKGAVACRDPEALVAKYSDPLVYTSSLRVRTGYEILRTSKHLQRNMRRLSVPFLVLHGTGDAITNPKGSEELYMEASSPDKTIKLYEGLLHDLLFEPERDIVVRDIMEWLSERT